MCTEEKYNYVLQSVSKGALSVNFSSIAIELNVPHDDFSLNAIELTFVVLRHGLKKSPVQSSKIFVRLGQGRFKSDYITRYLHTWVVLRLCIIFTYR